MTGNPPPNHVFVVLAQSHGWMQPVMLLKTVPAGRLLPAVTLAAEHLLRVLMGFYLGPARADGYSICKNCNQPKRKT